MMIFFHVLERLPIFLAYRVPKNFDLGIQWWAWGGSSVVMNVGCRFRAGRRALLGSLERAKTKALGTKNEKR